jgi:tetratricopeptide (TPR) repeat protein
MALQRKSALRVAGAVALAALAVFVAIVMVRAELENPPPAPAATVRVSRAAMNAIEAQRLIEEVRYPPMWHRRRDEAEAKLLQALALDPDNAGAWFSLGELRLQQDRDHEPDAAKAAEAFEHALRVDPKHAPAATALAAIAFSQRNFDRAEQLWLQAPDARESVTGLSKVYLLQGNYDEAARWAQTGLAARPNDSELAQILSAARSRTLDDNLRKELEPARPVPRLSRGVMEAFRFRAQGLRREAIEAFEAALRKDPNDTLGHDGLAAMLLEDGRIAEARAHYEAVLERLPDSFSGKNGLANCLKAEGRTDEAIKIWEQLVKPFEATDLGSGSPQLAQLYIELKRYDRAIDMLEQCVEANPGYVEGRKMLETARRAAAENSIK